MTPKNLIAEYSLFLLVDVELEEKVIYSHVLARKNSVQFVVVQYIDCILVFDSVVEYSLM